jgi:hypothetical protein
MRNFLLSIAVLLLLFGCGEKPCYEETEVFLNISFQTIVDSTGLPKDTSFSKLYVQGVGSQYILQYSGSNNDLLLDINNDFTQFNLDFNEEGNSDQIVFTYKRRMELISHECGFSMFFDSLHVEAFTNNFIDSVKIISNTVDNIKHENVKIYL